MKAKTLFLILLSSLLVVGCKNKSEENNEPTPPEPTFTKITEEQVKSYFPYTVGRELGFEDISYTNLYYTVTEAKLTNNSNKMELYVSMKGEESGSTGVAYDIIDMKTTVTDSKILKIEFTNYSVYSSSKIWETTGSYTYDASKNDSLPEKIVLSNGAIIQKDKGLIYYEGYDSTKWYFWQFLK